MSDSQNCSVPSLFVELGFPNSKSFCRISNLKGHTIHILVGINMGSGLESWCEKVEANLKELVRVMESSVECRVAPAQPA